MSLTVMFRASLLASGSFDFGVDCCWVLVSHDGLLTGWFDGMRGSMGDGVLWCCAVSCSVVQCRAVPCSVVPCRAVPCSAVLCSAVPCRAVPCSAVQCRAIRRDRSRLRRMARQDAQSRMRNDEWNERRV